MMYLKAIEQRLDSLLVRSYLGAPSSKKRDFDHQTVDWQDTRKFFCQLSTWLDQTYYDAKLKNEIRALLNEIVVTTISDNEINLKNGDTEYNLRKLTDGTIQQIDEEGQATEVLNVRYLWAILFCLLGPNKIYSSSLTTISSLTSDLLETCFP